MRIFRGTRDKSVLSLPVCSCLFDFSAKVAPPRYRTIQDWAFKDLPAGMEWVRSYQSQINEACVSTRSSHHSFISIPSLLASSSSSSSLSYLAAANDSDRGGMLFHAPATAMPPIPTLSDQSNQMLASALP
eukprot:751723-Hanusia_phi.AAC.1